MKYAWWRDLFLVIAVVRFGLVMGVELVVVVSRVKEVRKGDGEDMPQVGR